MQRIFGLLKRMNNRTNIRLAILAVVMGIGGFAVYQGVQRLRTPRIAPVAKKVTVGESAPAPKASEVQLASGVAAEGSVSMPAPLYGSHVNPPATTPPSAGHYSASLSDANDPYAAVNPYAAADQGAATTPNAAMGAPAELPPDALPPGTTVGENPYRTSSGENANPYGAELAAPVPAVAAAEPPPLATADAGSYPDPQTAALVEPTLPAENPYATSNGEYRTTTQPPAPLPSSGRRLNVGGAPPEGAGLPGERSLEGAQTPALSLEKFAPAEIQVGKAATFEVRVRNVGQVPAQQVVVTDHVPRGTKLIDAQPQPEQAADGSLQWSLGTMQPGDEATIQMNLMPQQEGEIGSVAQIGFAAHATARAICTKPMLVIEHTVPQQVMIGESLTMAIVVTNPGSGAAAGVVIDEDVPDGLSHVAGSELEYEVGTLRPGESKRLELSLKAEKQGVITNTIHVRGEAGLVAEHSVQIEVIAPQLQVQVNGPKKRFLERQATHTLSVANPGTAAAREVELVAYLPKGLKFVDTDSQGQYDPQQHAVYWSLEELPASKTGAVKLTTLPIEAGEQRLRIEGRADRGLNVAGEQVVQVEAAAELIYTITDLSDPIEVGSDTTYEIRVTNAGTKVATNIRINAILPAEMKALGGEGPTKALSDVQRVNFEPLPRLNPQDEAIFRVQAQALRAGDHILKVQVSSEEWPTPVTREESTRAYVDQ